MNTLILIGMPGSGKSECGRAIACSIKDSLFLETDKLIEETCNMSISSIFARHGEPFFRRLERLTVEILHDQIVKGAANLLAKEEDGEDPIKTGLLEKTVEMLERHTTMIVSTGGGLPVGEGNMAILKALGTVVYLAADADTLAERLQEDSTRPLLAGAKQPVDNGEDFNKEKLERISQLLRERDPVYRMADITIDTSFQTPESVVNRLIAEFNRLQTSEDFDKTV